MSSLVSNRLNDLYKKYFKNNDYTMGQDFESIRPQMSNEDYDLSQKLLSYYEQQNIAKNQFNFSNNEIEHQRSKALQQNDIARQKAMKYLPEYQRMQGMGRLGTSESALIATKNNFNNNRNTINADADSKLADLLDKYQVNMNAYDTSYLSDADSIRNKYELAKEKESEEIFNAFMDRLDSNKLEFNTSEELESDYNKIKDKLDGSKRSIIESKIDYYKNNLEIKESDAAYQEQKKLKEQEEKNKSKESTAIINGEKPINYNGKNYIIDSNQPIDMVNSDEIMKFYFGTNNPYSESIPNGSTLTAKDLETLVVQKEMDRLRLTGKDREIYYNKIYKPMLSKLEDNPGSITYFNGKWYKSIRQ